MAGENTTYGNKFVLLQPWTDTMDRAPVDRAPAHTARTAGELFVHWPAMAAIFAGCKSLRWMSVPNDRAVRTARGLPRGTKL